MDPAYERELKFDELRAYLFSLKDSIKSLVKSIRADDGDPFVRGRFESIAQEAGRIAGRAHANIALGERALESLQAKGSIRWDSHGEFTRDGRTYLVELSHRIDPLRSGRQQVALNIEETSPVPNDEKPIAFQFAFNLPTTYDPSHGVPVQFIQDQLVVLGQSADRLSNLSGRLSEDVGLLARPDVPPAEKHRILDEMLNAAKAASQDAAKAKRRQPQTQ